MHVCTLVTSGHLSLVNFWRLSWGTHTGRFIYPSLCTELICSVLALIIYNECSLSFLFAGLVVILLLQPTSSVAFLLIHYFMTFTSLSLHFFHFLALFVFSILTLLPVLFHLLSCCSDCPTVLEILCCSSTVLCLSRAREIIFCPTPIILPSGTDGSPGKQCSC